MRQVNHHHHHQLQQQQPPWTVSLRAKAKSLDFKLKLSSRLILPFFKIFQFSIQFKLHPYFLEIKCKPESSFLSKTKSLNLKFLQIFNSFPRKLSKNKGIVRSWFAHKNYLDGRKRRKNVCIWLCVLLSAVVVCFIVMQLMRYYFVWKYFWKAWQWHNATSSGLLNHFFKAIFDEIFQSIGFVVPE